jgi:hypothetical protein
MARGHSTDAQQNRPMKNAEENDENRDTFSEVAEPAARCVRNGMPGLEHGGVNSISKESNSNLASRFVSEGSGGCFDVNAGNAGRR